MTARISRDEAMEQIADALSDDDVGLNITSHIQHLANGFHSPNERDANGECANAVDGLFAIARAINNLALAVSGNDTTKSLTKAVDEIGAEIWKVSR